MRSLETDKRGMILKQPPQVQKKPQIFFKKPPFLMINDEPVNKFPNYFSTYSSFISIISWSHMRQCWSLVTRCSTHPWDLVTNGLEKYLLATQQRVAVCWQILLALAAPCSGHCPLVGGAVLCVDNNGGLNIVKLCQCIQGCWRLAAIQDTRYSATE